MLGVLGVLGLLEMGGYIVVEREHSRATSAHQEAKPWSRAVRMAPPGAVNCSIRFMVGFFMLPSSKLKPSQLPSLVFYRQTDAPGASRHLTFRSTDIT